MSLSLTSRRAELFAALLDDDSRSDDPVVAPFAALARSLTVLPAPAGPTPEFRSALRQRLVAVATVQGVAEAASPATRLREAGGTWKFQRRMAVLAGGAAAVTAIAGVGVGASRSLPGDPFYGVKRATERVQLAAAEGREAKGKRHLEFARTRLAEVEALAGRSSALSDFMPGTAGALGPLTDQARTSTVIATLQDMDDETRAGAGDLFAVYRSSGSAEPLRALDSFNRGQFAALRAVMPALSIEAQARAERSLSLLTIVATRTVTYAQAGAGPEGSTPQPGRGSGSPTPGRTTTPTPAKTGSHSPGADSQSPAPSPGDGTTLPSVPTDAPTIPPLPTLPPVPTQLPTALPTLPDLHLGG
ncbi:MAG: hypothetical protein QOJ03_1188 [Frankiaceae bacterium]|jgi:hypothetical protein|nr:hypothetical protein [Frankiaceae bacterium]